jgi:hypothetical protein
VDLGPQLNALSNSTSNPAQLSEGQKGLFDQLDKSLGAGGPSEKDLDKQAWILKLQNDLANLDKRSSSYVTEAEAIMSVLDALRR